ncbi:hypothetical protein BBJ28_00019077 [Nothophytophthora sp. Chile5]|nr:hypothetical protein BBJ28_00019077 [Nothophytophthora sp. Chile5]
MSQQEDVSSSDDENDLFGRLESDDLFEESSAQQEKRVEAQRFVEQYAQREWGLAARQRRVQGADSDTVTESSIELSPGKSVVFQEKQGQQAKVWDCALVLAKFLTNGAYFPRGFFENKRVVELGCGIGVPGLAAAVLGAKEVLLTDMVRALFCAIPKPMAIPWIQANIDRNQTAGQISNTVCADALMWGEQEQHDQRAFDVILCSDLVYGEPETSHKLAQTIASLSHADTLVVSAHEARFAGDRGQSFFSFLRKQRFAVELVPRASLDVVYSADNILPSKMRRSLRSFLPLRRTLSTSAAALPSSAPATAGATSLWEGVYNLDASKCHDPLVSEGDLGVMLDVITEDEEQVVADECSKILRRRRYEEDHWDSVIVKFKEMERSRWSTETQRILQKLRDAAILPKGLDYFPAVHVIELAEDGFIKAHVDSIKFSGRVVAGVNLLSPSIMRFNEEHGDSVIEAYLPRRSFYMMTYVLDGFASLEIGLVVLILTLLPISCCSGRVRYHYAHEILPGAQVFKGEIPVNRTHRISIMLRDEFLPEHIEKYHTPFAKPEADAQ